MPGAEIVLGLALGAVLSRVHVAHGSALDAIAFKGSEADARQLLAVVTGTMITVTSLVFALTVATLQTARRSTRRGCCARSCAIAGRRW
jgi:uncharacterized membrane protein